MIFYTVDVGVVLRFPVYLNGARPNLTAPAPQAAALLVDTPNASLTFALSVDPGDTARLIRTVLAGDFPDPGVFPAVVRLTFDATHVFHSEGFSLVVNPLFAQVGG